MNAFSPLTCQQNKYEKSLRLSVKMAESNITRYVNYSEAIMENPAESQLLQSIQNINIPVKTVYVLPLPRTVCRKHETCNM